MRDLVVVENTKRWALGELEGAEVVPARAYLTDPAYAGLRRAAVYNLCRNYGYQTVGYYVSLLAQARGHRVLPSVATLQALGETALVRIASDELDELIQRSLAPLRSEEFRLSVYFGRNVARRYDRLSRALYNQFPAPFLRARFAWSGGPGSGPDRWKLVSIRPVAASDVPDGHRDFVIEQARRFFERPTRLRPKKEYRYDMAVLWSADDPLAPSDPQAIRRFRKAFAKAGIGTELVGPDDYGRVGEYDALFIRETTRVEHHTYRFARRAEAEGLVVLDHPDAIVRCGNKVYQAELFERHGIACPETLVVHEGNTGEVAELVGLPCVLKKPDGAFSQGVVKIESKGELAARLPELLHESELVVAQAYTPSTFDWRVGVLEGRALFVCRYHMAPGHWQIVRGSGRGARYGEVECVRVADAPPEVVELGVRAASLIGDGLFGVDLKVVDGRVVVMEINDNPNVDADTEDQLPERDVYEAVADWFRRRLDARGRSQP